MRREKEDDSDDDDSDDGPKAAARGLALDRATGRQPAPDSDHPPLKERNTGRRGPGRGGGKGLWRERKGRIQYTRRKLLLVGRKA